MPEIDYNAVVEAKIKRLQELCEQGIWTGFSFNAVRPTEEELKASYEKKIKLVKESGARRTQEMVAKITSLGYEVVWSRVSDKGVLSLVASRNGYKLFGFASPTGKLILSNEKKENVLVINYQRKNLKCHDKFLEVVVKGI